MILWLHALDITFSFLFINDLYTLSQHSFTYYFFSFPLPQHSLFSDSQMMQCIHDSCAQPYSLVYKLG